MVLFTDLFIEDSGFSGRFLLLACRRVVNIAEPVHLAAGGITDEACPSAAGTCTSSTLLSLCSRIAADLQLFTVY